MVTHFIVPMLGILLYVRYKVNRGGYPHPLVAYSITKIRPFSRFLLPGFCSIILLAQHLTIFRNSYFAGLFTNTSSGLSRYSFCDKTVS